MSKVKFKCVMERQIFVSKDHKYQICAVSTLDTRITKNKYGNATIVGAMPELTEGVEYTVEATEEDGKYGVQYKVKSCMRDTSLNENNTRLFLSEILVASQVDEIMRGCPNIIELVINGREDEIDLNKLHNIKDERIKVIKRKILDNYVFSALISEFMGLFNFQAIKELYSEFHDVEKVKENLKSDPYGVLCDRMNYSFKAADRLLLDFANEIADLESPPIKFDEDLKASAMRLESAIVYLLKENEFTGNTKMLIRELEKECKKITPQAIHRFDDVLKNSKRIKVDSKYISRMIAYETELYIAEKLARMASAENLWTFTNTKGEVKNTHGLTDEQMDVVYKLNNVNVSICNGSAGVGKSFLTKLVVDSIRSKGKSITICAPTGR